MVGVLLLVVQTPAPLPCVHSNCTVSPDWKLLPLMVSVWVTPFAVIAVGEILLTVGVNTAAVTATDCVPDVQVPAELHTRTEMVSVTVPGFMLTVICVELTMVGALPGFHVPLLGGTVHMNCTVSPLWKLLPSMVIVWPYNGAVKVVGLTPIIDGAVKLRGW